MFKNNRKPLLYTLTSRRSKSTISENVGSKRKRNEAVEEEFIARPTISHKRNKLNTTQGVPVRALLDDMSVQEVKPARKRVKPNVKKPVRMIEDDLSDEEELDDGMDFFDFNFDFGEVSESDDEDIELGSNGKFETKGTLYASMYTSVDSALRLTKSIDELDTRIEKNVRCVTYNSIARCSDDKKALQGHFLFGTGLQVLRKNLERRRVDRRERSSH